MARCLTVFSALLLAASACGETFTVQRGSDLQLVIDYAAAGDTIILGPKEFVASPTRFVDPLCGNCEDPATESETTSGFVISNKSLVLVGADRDLSRLVTRAGYGLLIVNSPDTRIHNLTVTGGIRSNDGRATDAGIVVRNSRVTISHVTVADNTDRADDTSVVVGIGGIIGREGADLRIEHCRIVDNGWDGLALYRGAQAHIADCTIENGRGVGIGVTWDASCTAVRNRISGYWKGIGAFGRSWVMARNNLIYDNLGWGMVATGAAYMDISNNVVFHNGNCGIAPWSQECRGRIINNIVVANGWRQEWVCKCVGVWNNGDWAKWEFAYNLVWGNATGDYADIFNQSGINGNLSEDPHFSGVSFPLPDSVAPLFQLPPDVGVFELMTTSPARFAGDTAIYNPDGSRSHIGLFGGPQAKPPRPSP